jgi:hypothetical protein
MKILVCDDEPDRCKAVVDTIKECGVVGADDITSLAGKELTNALVSLFANVRGCLNDANGCNQGGPLKFDEHDIAIFDNNLALLETEGARLTGEAVVGYVRSFTTVPYIISLNKNPDVDFDLRYLVGDDETRADIALNIDHLANLALWTGNQSDATKGFLPWYWPKLTSVAERRRRQIEFVRRHLNTPVLGALQFPSDEDSLGFLSLHAKGALSPEAALDDGALDEAGIPLAALTFLQTFEGKSRSLPAAADRVKLCRLAANGNAYAVEIIARAVAADIDLWFRRDVVGPQEMLVDIPHLMTRMPFVLGDEVGNIDAWNRAAALVDPPFGMEESLYGRHLAAAKFAYDMWVPHPAFWWPTLKKNDELGGLFFSGDQKGWADVVFDEDRSAFVQRPPADGDGPSEIATELEGPWARRYVARIDGIKYAPLTRFAALG